ESVSNRLDTHVVEKDFWDRGLVFTSNSGALNQAHAMWLEHALIERARSIKQCFLDNNNTAQKVFLSPADEADTRVFLKEILQILPLLGVRAFEARKPVATPQAEFNVTARVDGPRAGSAKTQQEDENQFDTIVLPTGDPEDADGFKKYFLNGNCWFPVRISGGKLNRIKYVAAYQSRPISAITHYAPVAAIEPYGEDGKYKLIFSAPAQQLSPLPVGNAITLRSPRYTSLSRLKIAKTFADVFVERLE
ncbi:MAG: GIY-YIG nuclease family protein, partial [Rhodomicrobium sp.]